LSALNGDDVRRALETIDQSVGDEAQVRVGDLAIEVRRADARPQKKPLMTDQSQDTGGAELSSAEIAEVIELVRDSDFVEVRIETGDLRLLLSRRGPSSSEQDPRPLFAPDRASAERAAMGTEEATPAAAAPATLNSAASPGRLMIPAPVLGTFYRGPSPEEPPFVEPGSRVDEDTVVCIIEVMKLMNHVVAQVRGVVEEVLVDDGSLVEYGQPLFSVRPA
jgi:acetyl-CoA carboxylase biotin carboxyl carrier protein